MIVFLRLKEHLDQFHPNSICEYCNKKLDSINALNQHHVSECQEITYDCELKIFGCNEPV